MEIKETSNITFSTLTPNSNPINEKEKEKENFNIKIIFRRKFGKKLCFIKGETDEFKTIEIKLQIYDLIRQIKIGDYINISGFYKLDQIKNIEIFQCEEIKILKKSPSGEKLNQKRYEISSNEINNNNNNEKSEKTLCKFFRNSKICEIENCIFRHFLIKDDEIKLQISKEKKENMYKEHHEGDVIRKEDKQVKNARHKLFADFLVKIYGIEFLKTGPILDVAGGKGLVSFYLKTEYDLESIIIDDRGITLPKAYRKILNKKSIKIEERRELFNEDFDKELVKKASLVIGMHPDEATDYIINISLLNNKKFAVVPCCVFPNLFNNRYLKNGEFVSDYPKYVNFITENLEKYKIFHLEITGRNKVIYLD